MPDVISQQLHSEIHHLQHYQPGVARLHNSALLLKQFDDGRDTNPSPPADKAPHKKPGGASSRTVHHVNTVQGMVKDYERQIM
jgi:bisphosphoglycerate-independent phosphoglycerate mutase (AlkP superfamily)